MVGTSRVHARAIKNTKNAVWIKIFEKFFQLLIKYFGILEFQIVCRYGAFDTSDSVQVGKQTDP